MRKTKTARAERAAQFTDEERAARRARAEGLRKVARMWLDVEVDGRKIRSINENRCLKLIADAQTGLLALRHPIQRKMLTRRLAALWLHLRAIRVEDEGAIRAIMANAGFNGGPPVSATIDMLFGNRSADLDAVFAGLARMSVPALAVAVDKLEFIAKRGSSVAANAVALFNGELHRREIALNGCDPDDGLPAADGRPVHHADRWAADVGIPTADVQIVTPKKRPASPLEMIAALNQIVSVAPIREPKP